MIKRIISLLLTTVIFCCSLTVFATENAFDIELNIVEPMSDVELDVETLPQITLDDNDAVSLGVDISARKELNFKEWEKVTSTPEISFDNNDVIDVQKNITENVESGADYANARSVTLASDSAHRISNMNGKDSFALQNQTGRTNFIGDNIGQEYIDPMTGNLIVTETDLVLPGVDGLDLNLSRYYSLAQAELYTKTAEIVSGPKTYTFPQDGYIVTETISNLVTGEVSYYQYPYLEFLEAELRMDEIESRDTANNTYQYTASYETCNAGETLTFDYYYTAKKGATSYQRMRNDLGAGWSWSFPSVQTVKDNYRSNTEMPKALYYHDGKGNVMEVEYDGNYDCSFVNYTGGDITFEILYDYYDDICSTSRLDYMVEDSDGTKYYFGMFGEIRTIMDRYGNKIAFVYTSKDFYGAEDVPVISSITDTVGRIVNFEYTSENTTEGNFEIITLTVTSPFENERSLTLSYKKKMLSISTDGEPTSAEPILESFTNSIGEETKYFPAWVEGTRTNTRSILFTFSDKTFNSVYAEDCVS